MASGDLVRYVITVMLHEDTLTEINELNNYLTRDGFLLTMTDDEGNIHELGTNTFGLISTQSEEEIRELVSGLTQSATGKDPPGCRNSISSLVKRRPRAAARYLSPL